MEPLPWCTDPRVDGQTYEEQNEEEGRPGIVPGDGLALEEGDRLSPEEHQRACAPKDQGWAGDRQGGPVRPAQDVGVDLSAEGDFHGRAQVAMGDCTLLGPIEIRSPKEVASDED